MTSLRNPMRSRLPAAAWRAGLVVLVVTVVPVLPGGWAGPVEAVAQVNRQQVRPQRQQLESRVRQAFRNRVRQDLQLTRDEIPALTEVIEWSEGQRSSIAQRTRNLNDRAIQYLRDGGPEEDARAILEERRNLQGEEAELFAEEQDRLLTVLSPNQVVRFYRLRDDFNRRLLQARARQNNNGNNGNNGRQDPPEEPGSAR